MHSGYSGNDPRLALRRLRCARERRPGQARIRATETGSVVEVVGPIGDRPTLPRSIWLRARTELLQPTARADENTRSFSCRCEMRGRRRSQHPTATLTLSLEAGVV
jgi:hypothetical protein